MKRNRMSKLSASLIVLVMAMSALVLLPSESSTGQTVQTNVIEIPVQDTHGFFVSSATVDLTNVHTGAAIRATLTTPGLYHADNVPAGMYRIDVVAADYYDNHTVVINFNAYSSLVTPTVLLKAFGTKSNTWTVTVQKASDSSAISGATVGFFDCMLNETVASATSNSTGVAVVSMFTTQPTDKFVLYAKAVGYNTTFEEMVVAGSGFRTWSLDASKRVTGYVKNWAGTALLNNVVGYMISSDTTLPQIARVLKSDNGGKSFEFDAYPGDFIMTVDADNGSAYVSAIHIFAGDSYSYNDFRLENQIQRTEQSSIVFGTDYQDFTLSVDTTWSFDEAHPALLYDDIGSLRMQIDLALGNCDGQLSQSEVDAFSAMIAGLGPQYATSSGLVQVNATLFDPGALTGYVMDLAAGSVISEAGVHYAYSCTYAKHGTIDVGSSKYSVDVTARYDSYEVDYKYSVTPTSGFELVSNQSTSLVKVMGYSVVSLDPKFVAAGGQEAVAMLVEESVMPDAAAGILDGTHAHAVTVDDNVSYYLVAVNENVTLTAAGSYDPNGNPLAYSWNFGDSTPVLDTSNVTVEHMFTTSANFTVNLTVTDAVGLQNWSEISVLGDALVPTPVISVKDKTVVDNTIEVNMREVVTFNATSSTDSAVTAGDGMGVIDHFMFDWGDLNHSSRVMWTANDKNVSTSWERSGTYTVNLNVTDVVGHWVNATMTVKVNDTEAPKVSYVVKNATWESTYIENETLTFDATATTDNVDLFGALYFSWNFSDGSDLVNGYGADGYGNVTHQFNSTGDFNVALNVTDSTGNYKVERKLISVLSGPRPDLWIERVYYDPLNFTEGSSGLILVNVTNKGSVNATNLQISFYIVRSDGTEKVISGSGTLYDANGAPIDIIEVGQKAQYRLSYTPGSKGTFIIRVNVTCDDQLRPYLFTASGDSALHVKEAAWKQWALWGGVLAIIVLIPLLLMFRGRLAKREKKGPRRERKEKEKEKVSDEEL